MSSPAPRSSRRRPPARSGLVRSFLDLGAAQQRTAAAALVVLVSLGAPWYSTEVAFPATRGRPASVVQGTMSGISAFSFVEAAVLLVAAAVLALVWARATERSFSLPAGDGTVVTGAAGWLGLLIVYRLFDRPEGGTDGATATLVGLSWGIFATLAAVGLLLATGLDQRRRDAERRVAAPVVPDGPVVDPADVVPVTDRPTWDGPRGAGAQAGEREPSAVAERPARSGVPVPSPDAVPDPRPGGDAAPREAPSRARSWSFDDPDSPEPAPPRDPPSRRRPVPPEAPTRAISRDPGPAGRDDGSAPDDVGRDATRQDDVRGPDAADDPTRVAFRPADTGPGRAAGYVAEERTRADGRPEDDPTRVLGTDRTAGRDAAHVVSWDGAADPTRALPPAAERDADRDDTDVTRHHDVPQRAPEGDRPRRGFRRRRDGS
ncbi:hypothetical protein [Patulibacter sp.]|uniref:hypothetical protein n=1 Tax=Patulibacter sp. TaxID=1912859 RepID=UPI00272267C3|nr:hypothetical protein [Patulibacter sp.]MDO9410700.1 hypothetical protein [Patulibacter sp.]